MADRARCKCRRCTIGGLMGPAVLITLGLLFLVGRLGLGYSFSDLWPVLLIVIGAVKLLEAMTSTEGHVGQ